MKDHNESLFRGTGEVFDMSGRRLDLESYILVATMTKSGDELIFEETKKYSDGRQYSMPFILSLIEKPFDYSDEYKTVRGIYLSKNQCVGYQKIHGFEDSFFCNFTEDKVEITTVAADRVIVEKMERIFPT